MSERAFRVSYRTGGSGVYGVEFTECEYQDCLRDAIWIYVRHVASGNPAAIFAYDNEADDYRRVDARTLDWIYTMARRGAKEDKIAEDVNLEFE